MEIIAYAKIISSTSLEYAPSQYNGISNFNNCEDLMLQNGFYPVIKQEVEDKPIFSYKISQEKIDLVVTTLDNIKKHNEDEKNEHKIQIAYGFYFSNTELVDEIWQKADELMYEKKKQMKN